MSRWSDAWASSRQLLIACTETPGPGIEAPSRYTAMIARENSSLRRRSGVRNAAANACSTCPPRVGRSTLARRGPVASRAAGPRRSPAWSRRAAGAGGPASDLGGAAPGSADLLLGGLGERVRVHVHRHAAQLARAEHLDRLTAPDGAGVGQRVRVDLAALREQGGDPVQVHDLEHDLVVVGEA